MIHARDDYNRIQDPALDDPSLLGDGCSPIGKDEPVFLLRCKDKHFQEMCRHYMAAVAQDHENGDYRLIESLTKHILLAVQWQNANGMKAPDMPGPVPK